MNQPLIFQGVFHKKHISGTVVLGKFWFGKRTIFQDPESPPVVLRPAKAKAKLPSGSDRVGVFPQVSSLVVHPCN